nr:hypothetical protein CPGR_02231 [Mycolicibacterium malmesburyense]
MTAGRCWTWRARRTSSLTAELPVALPNSARPAPSWRSGSATWSCCRSPTSASTDPMPRGRLPTRFCTRCRRRCRVRDRPPAPRCCPRSAWHRAPRRRRPRGPGSPPTIVGYATAQAISSTSPASRRCSKHWIRRSDRRARRPSASRRPPRSGAAGPVTRTSIRSSPARMATSGSACCRRASGAPCTPGSANPNSSPTRSSRRSPRATRPLASSTPLSATSSHRRRWTIWSPRDSPGAFRSSRSSPRPRRWPPSTSARSAR